jgi:hypothetical protein
MSDVIKKRRAGISIEDAIEEVFKPENPPAGAEAQSEQPVPAAPGAAPAGGASAQPQGMPLPEERPELQTLLSTLTGGGKAQSAARLSQQRRV